MDKLRNIVILKDLPSNTIEEAFIVLKKSQKVKNLEHIDKYKDFSSEKNREEDKDFIIKEAELLIQNYFEKNQNNGNIDDILCKKNKRLKRAVAILSCSLFLAVIYILL